MTAVALLLTLAMAAPVLVAPSQRLFGEEIAGRHHDPFTVIAQFENPRPLGLFTQPVTDWVGAAGAILLGDGVRAYNLIVLISFPLAALFAFLFAREVTGSTRAAWLAALIYAFLPFHWAHAAYHPHGAQTQWLPLYFLALWLCVERFSARRAALLAGAAALVALSNFYFGLIAAVLTPVALAAQWRLVPPPRGEPRHRSPLRTLGLLLLLAAAGLTYVAVWAPTVLAEPGRFAFPAADVARYTVRAWCYLVPAVGHPLAGDRLAGFWARQDSGGLVERQVALGLGVLSLAAFALVARLRGRQSALLRGVPVLGFLALVAFSFSLAPVWRLGPLELPGPSGLLYRLLPMFRAHGRFALVVGLAMALLAGVGFQLLWRHRPAGRIVAVALLGLVTLEVAPFPPWRWRDVLPTSAHRWLAQRDGPVRVLDCVGGREPAQASVQRLFPKRLSRLPPGADCGDPQLPAIFAAQGFSHLLVRSDSPFGRWLAGRPAPSGLEPVGDFEDAFLFRLEENPPLLRARYADGFHAREYVAEGGYRWMRDRGSLELTVAAAEPRPTALDLRLHAFPAPRRLEARLDGRRLGPIEVPTEPAVRRLELGSLTPGRYLLELTGTEPAAIPDRILGNGDLRPVTVALWSWSWIRSREEDRPGAPDGSGAPPTRQLPAPPRSGPERR